MPIMASLRTTSCALSLIVVASGCFTSTTVAAQGTEITPFLGALLPLNDNVNEDEFRSKHASGLGGGVRVVHRFPGRLGFEGSVAYSSSDVDIDDDGFDLSFGANILAIGGKVLYQLSAPESRARFHVAAGPAIVMRGGDYYDELELEGTTDVGLVLGAAVRVPIGDRLGMTIQLEDFITSLKLQEGSQSTQSRLQNDVMLSVGVAIPIGARP